MSCGRSWGGELAVGESLFWPCVFFAGGADESGLLVMPGGLIGRSHAVGVGAFVAQGSMLGRACVAVCSVETASYLIGSFNGEKVFRTWRNFPCS